MAAAKGQQANGAKKCEKGRPKTVRNRQPQKCEDDRKKVQKKVQKEAKRGEKVRKRSRCFLLIVFFGHFPVAIERWPFRFSLFKRGRWEFAQFQTPMCCCWWKATRPLSDALSNCV